MKHYRMKLKTLTLKYSMFYVVCLNEDVLDKAKNPKQNVGFKLTCDIKKEILIFVGMPKKNVHSLQKVKMRLLYFSAIH